MKKLLVLTLAAAFSLASAIGCSGTPSTTKDTKVTPTPPQPTGPKDPGKDTGKETKPKETKP